MVTKYSFDFQDRIPKVNYKCNFLYNYIGDESSKTKSPFSSNYFYGEEKEEENYFLNIDYLNNLMPYNYEENSNINIDEEDDDKKYINASSCGLFGNFRNNLNSFLEINSKKSLIFEINYCPKNSLFTKAKVNNYSVEKEKERNFLKRKRSTSRRKRKENKDNIRKKIKRGFLNNTIIEKLNEKLRNIGSKTYFEKVPQRFASDVDQKRNKKILNIKLKEIFENKELYVKEKKKGLDNFKHNLKVIQSEEVKNNEIFKNILNKTFRQLYEEYLDSNEFEIYEINRLKNKKMDEEYIRRYKEFAKDLMNFFCK